jgi:hypothetical protein
MYDTNVQLFIGLNNKRGDILIPDPNLGEYLAVLIVCFRKYSKFAVALGV